MQITLLDALKQQLIGKVVRHRNRYGRMADLEVENLTEDRGSRDLEPATRENDWWPASESWTHYYLHFKDGSKVQVNLTDKFEIIN